MVCHVDLIPIAALFDLVHPDHHTQLHGVFVCLFVLVFFFFTDFSISLYGLADISQSQIQFKTYEDVIHQNLFSL